MVARDQTEMKAKRSASKMVRKNASIKNTTEDKTIIDQLDQQSLTWTHCF